MQAIQNLGLALITMLSGLVVDRMGYLWLELFFIFWLAVALVATVFIWLIDLVRNFNPKDIYIFTVLFAGNGV